MYHSADNIAIILQIINFLAARSQQQTSVSSIPTTCLFGTACDGCANDNTVVVTPLGIQQRNVVRRLPKRYNPNTGVANNDQDVCCGLCAPILGKPGIC